MAAAAAAAAEENKEDDFYRIKVVKFFDRFVPIVLQNSNGPCPLLAICNVLSLRNNCPLSLDGSEISQQQLLHLVAEKIVDANTNLENKDPGVLNNQLQNVSDALELIPKLATGLDVSVRFRNIHDFEYTPVCAIFDLLDIELVHGWIIDPQDKDTAAAVESNSYNTLMEKLIELEPRNIEGYQERYTEEDSVDFAAATTATLGVPSPSISRVRSFGDSTGEVSTEGIRKGDVEEAAELLKALELSRDDPHTEMERNILASNSIESPNFISENIGAPDLPATSTENHELLKSQESIDGIPLTSPPMSFGGLNNEATATHGAQEEVLGSSVDLSHPTPDGLKLPDLSSTFDWHSVNESLDPIGQFASTSLVNLSKDDSPSAGARDAEIETQVSGESDQVGVSNEVCSSLGDSEPIYEGEDFIHEQELAMNENREPMYEGEMVLAEQANGGGDELSSIRQGNSEALSSNGAANREGELISNFLTSNASQLTIYGLFCLQEHLKEHGFCAFFRNNHFSTMFKHEGQLYLLATDQGYLSQPDLVWEKLNEVNGDTVFMTGDFGEFRVRDDGTREWNEQNAVNSTADYLANMENSSNSYSSMSADMQLAIQLQQQELGNQPQRQNLPSSQPQPIRPTGLVTGPEVRRPSGGAPSSYRQDLKSKEKDKCTLM